MKKVAVFALLLLSLGACETSGDSQEDLNSIPEQLSGVSPEV